MFVVTVMFFFLKKSFSGPHTWIYSATNIKKMSSIGEIKSFECEKVL